MREERLYEWCYFGTRYARSYALPALSSNSSVIDPSRLAPANQADQGAQLRRAVMGRAKLMLFPVITPGPDCSTDVRYGRRSSDKPLAAGR